MIRAMNRIVGGLVLTFILLLAGCQAQKSGTGTTTPTVPPAKSKASPPPVPQASAQSSGYGIMPPPRVDIESIKDTVVWETVPSDLRPDSPHEGARELPGERLGLIGPIVAKSTSAEKPYIVVYDSSGALVGGLLLEEARREPDRLNYLLQRAMERSAVQNRMALEVMRTYGTLKN